MKLEELRRSKRDAILQLVITEYLYGHFRSEAEGQLTKLRSRLVSREALKGHALALDLGSYLMMGRGEEASGGRERGSTLADAYEALIGAIYLDSDLATAKKFILAQARADLDLLAEAPIDINPKGQLQELLQSISPRSPVYELISQSGPEHEKTFVVQANGTKSWKVWDTPDIRPGREVTVERDASATRPAACSVSASDSATRRSAKDTPRGHRPDEAFRRRPRPCPERLVSRFRHHN